MHLTGEAGAGDLFCVDAARFDDRADCFLRSAPPIGRFLFSPRGFRRGERRVFARGRCDYRAIFGHKDSASAAGADVYAKDRNVMLPGLFYRTLERECIEILSGGDQYVLAAIQHISDWTIAGIGQQG